MHSPCCVIVLVSPLTGGTSVLLTGRLPRVERASLVLHTPWAVLVLGEALFVCYVVGLKVLVGVVLALVSFVVVKVALAVGLAIAQCPFVSAKGVVFRHRVANLGPLYRVFRSLALVRVRTPILSIPLLWLSAILVRILSRKFRPSFIIQHAALLSRHIESILQAVVLVLVSGRVALVIAAWSRTSLLRLSVTVSAVVFTVVQLGSCSCYKDRGVRPVRPNRTIRSPDLVAFGIFGYENSCLIRRNSVEWPSCHKNNTPLTGQLMHMYK